MKFCKEYTNNKIIRKPNWINQIEDYFCLQEKVTLNKDVALRKDSDNSNRNKVLSLKK